MTLIKHLILNLGLMLLLDTLWFKAFAGSYFADQLKDIGRFGESGGFDVRMVPAVLTYLLMALALEMFIFRNQSLVTLNQFLVHGFLLGLCIFGIFDLTNRSIIENYPMGMVVVDIAWGCFLYTAVTYLNYELRRRLTFL